MGVYDSLTLTEIIFQWKRDIVKLFRNNQEAQFLYSYGMKSLTFSHDYRYHYPAPLFYTDIKIIPVLATEPH
jgi:hypothetical protein